MMYIENLLKLLKFYVKNLTYTVGIPCICIGVGLLIPFSSNATKMPLWSFISLKVFKGGGISSPSTKILNSLLMRLCLLSGISKTYRGALQLKKQTK